jgi:hypothetical protein
MREQHGEYRSENAAADHLGELSYHDRHRVHT